MQNQTVSLIVPQVEADYSSLSDTIVDSPFDLDTMLFSQTADATVAHAVAQASMQCDFEYRRVPFPDWVSEEYEGAFWDHHRHCIDQSDAVIPVVIPKYSTHVLPGHARAHAQARGCPVYNVTVRINDGEAVVQRTELVEGDQAELAEF